MDIERLKELKQQVFDSFQLYEVKMQNNFDESMKTATPTGEMDDDGKDLTALIDEAIARQSVTSEEVAGAIELLREPSKGMDYYWLDAQMHDALDLAITALQAYQPWVPVSDRLPEEGAIVMVAYGEAIYFASIQYWGIHGKEVPVWRVGMGHRIEKDFSETHWKPYPETPKGE